MKADPVARRIAYAMVWRNSKPGHFWIPYPGHPDVPDFKAFYADPMTVFERDLPDMYTMPGTKGE
jgi:mannan endo-1,4-beta-mannosidase